MVRLLLMACKKAAFACTPGSLDDALGLATERPGKPQNSQQMAFDEDHWTFFVQGCAEDIVTFADNRAVSELE